MTTKFAVFGSPIDHSLSPVLHAAAYDYLNFPIDYQKQEVVAGKLAQTLATTSFDAISVTMPLKNEAFVLSSAKSEVARLTQVVNSLVRREGKWLGDNTDVYGLAKALSKLEKISRVLVIGSGATSRSALVALSQLFPNARVSIAARNQDAVADMLDFSESLDLSAELVPLTQDALYSNELVLSLVPNGALSQFWNSLDFSGSSPEGFLFDVAYNPWPSDASQGWNGGRVISGLEMLIWQAVAQIKFFTKNLGLVANFDDYELYGVMKAAAVSH